MANILKTHASQKLFIACLISNILFLIKFIYLFLAACNSRDIEA